MIVKTNDGYIFGGFNPTSWVSEFMYSECEDAYLFSSLMEKEGNQ